MLPALSLESRLTLQSKPPLRLPQNIPARLHCMKIVSKEDSNSCGKYTHVQLHLVFCCMDSYWRKSHGLLWEFCACSCFLYCKRYKLEDGWPPFEGGGHWVEREGNKGKCSNSPHSSPCQPPTTVDWIQSSTQVFSSFFALLNVFFFLTIFCKLQTFQWTSHDKSTRTCLPYPHYVNIDGMP